MHIEFNRNNHQLFAETFHPTNINHGTYSHMKESTTAGFGSFSPSRPRLLGVKEKSLPKNIDECFVGCFIIENESYLELRDCFIHSIKDAKVIELEKE